jgi:hypothetical protein
MAAFQLAMESDSQTFSRTAYTYIDLLADIGGIRSAAQLLARFLLTIMTIITPLNTTTRRLTGKLFWMPSSTNEFYKDKVDMLMDRRKAIVGKGRYFLCIGNRRD